LRTKLAEQTAAADRRLLGLVLRITFLQAAGR